MRSIGRNRFVNWSCAVSGNFMWHLTKGQKSLLQTGRGSEQFLFPVSLEALLMATFGLFQEYITQCSWGKKTTVAEICRGTLLVGICVWGEGGCSGGF